MTFSSHKVNVKVSDIDMCSAIYFLFDHNTKYCTIYLCQHTVLATVWLSPRRLGNRTRLYSMLGCFGFNGPLRQYFSLYRAISQREGERRERIDESKNVQTTPTRTYCKRNRPLPYCNQNCRTPRHWKLTQRHRTTRPPPIVLDCTPLLSSAVLLPGPTNSRDFYILGHLAASKR